MAKRNTPTKQLLRKSVETLMHDEASRKNIPTAEYQSVLQKEEQRPVRVTLPRNAAGLESEKARRNRDLDPQLVWRGKDEQDWSDLVVQAPPIYIQEKVHPKVLIDDLLKHTKVEEKTEEVQVNLFADFNGLPDEEAKTEFYQHDANWSNRMILGDSLQVMASLAEREGLRGKVQCIYFDPPYGIKFNSNFQWSTTSRDVKDGNTDHITREPEQVKAFRDTWRDGIHSYLTYLFDRLTVARDLLADSGSIFVQIGDENVHRVRAVMDEVFGEDNFLSEIVFQKTGGFAPSGVSNISDYILWFAKNREMAKTRPTYESSPRPSLGDPYYVFLESEDFSVQRMTTSQRDGIEALPPNQKIYRLGPLQSDGASTSPQEFKCRGDTFKPAMNSHWKTTILGLERMAKADRFVFTKTGIHHKLYWHNWPAKRRDNLWLDTQSGGFNQAKTYVVQTNTKVVDRCMLMATDPGDLVLDPTCGSGTTATVAEQWGRRWITIDTSRVALALARARIMGARYAYYLLADSPAGQLKEAVVTRTAPSNQPTRGDIRQGFVYERVPHITLKSIANNSEIDVIWEKFQPMVTTLREQLNEAMAKRWEEWEIPREAEDPWDTATQRIFYQLETERARGENANPTKMLESLLALNHNLKRNFTLNST